MWFARNYLYVPQFPSSTNYFQNFQLCQASCVLGKQKEMPHTEAEKLLFYQRNKLIPAEESACIDFLEIGDGRFWKFTCRDMKFNDPYLNVSPVLLNSTYNAKKKEKSQLSQGKSFLYDLFPSRVSSVQNNLCESLLVASHNFASLKQSPYKFW